VHGAHDSPEPSPSDGSIYLADLSLHYLTLNFEL
jgi:hypothetical protein